MKTTQLKMLLHYLLGLSVMGFLSWPVSLLSKQIPMNSFLKLIPSLVLMVAAIICHNKAKGHTFGYLLSYYLNAVGSGAIIGVVLAECNITPSLNLVLALLPAAGLGILVSVLLMVFKKTDSICATFTVLTLLIIGVAIYIWIAKSALVGSTLLFSSLFFLPFPFSSQNAVEKPDQSLRHLSFAGFGAFSVIAFVSMVILSEGEILEGAFDGLDFGGGKGKRKK